MVDSLMDHLAGKDIRGFNARPQYCADGDFLTFFFRDEDCCGERVDELLTVYHSWKSDELVGCKIKGIRRILEALGDFGVLVHEAPITLGLLFLAGMAVSEGPPERKQQYDMISQRARHVTLDARELQPT